MKNRTFARAIRLGFVSLILLFLVFCNGGSGPTAPGQQGETVTALDGPWGGDHIQMIIEGSSVRIEFDCAHATLSRPAPDAHGAFSVSGTYFQEHGGPIQIGEEEKGQPAEFRGTVSGATMSMQILVSGSKDAIGPFTLKHNEQGHLMKCL